MAPPLPTVDVLPARPAHADALERLQYVVYREGETGAMPDSLKAHHFRAQVAAFPEGQFVAVERVTGRVVGHTACMRIDYDPARPFLDPWLVTTGGGTLSTHNPDGAWLYGVESAVLPDYQGRGIGRRLYAARFDLARRLGLSGMVAGSTIMDYHRVAASMSPDAYLEAVVAGRLFDTNLSKQLRLGFRALNVIPNYVSDVLSCGYGVAIVWQAAAAGL
jgi:GNAT superfamily N-acetyltransferase